MDMEWYDRLILHWPFLAVSFTLAILGDVLGRRIFTRERAYRFRGNTLQARLLHSFLYWGRELLPVLHIGAGFLVGKYWVDPGSLGWSKLASQWYFTFAGGVSMFAWAILKGRAKHAGIVLELPGESSLPPPPTEEAHDGEAPPNDP